MHLSSPIDITLQGLYKLSVIDSDNNEIYSQKEWNKNLILNKGMDALGDTIYFMNASLFAFAGTGMRSSSISSGDSSGSVSNGFIYLYTGSSGLQDFTSSGIAGYTNSGSLSLGDIVKFADSTEVNVSGAVSGFSASIIENTATVQTQSFTIWKTSQTNLENIIRKAGSSIGTSSFFTDDGSCGTFISASSGSVYHLRTFDFGSESVQRNYTEIGVGWTINDVFARTRLTEPFVVDTDKRLRLRYMLQVNFSPTASYPVSNATMNGWPISPATNTHLSQSVQMINTVTVSTVTSTGGVKSTDDIALEPASNSGTELVVWASSDSRSLAPCGSNTSRDNGTFDYVTALVLPYVKGSYQNIKYGLFDVDSMNGTGSNGFGNVWSFGLGCFHVSYYTQIAYPFTNAQAFTAVLQQGQTKNDTQRLIISFIYSWRRALE